MFTACIHNNAFSKKGKNLNTCSSQKTCHMKLHKVPFESSFSALFIGARCQVIRTGCFSQSANKDHTPIQSALPINGSIMICKLYYYHIQLWKHTWVAWPCDPVLPKTFVTWRNHNKFHTRTIFGVCKSLAKNCYWHTEKTLLSTKNVSTI